MSVSSGAALKLNLKTPEPPRLLECAAFNGALSPIAAELSSGCRMLVDGWPGSSKFVSNIWPTLLDLLPLKLTELLGSSSRLVSSNLLD